MSITNALRMGFSLAFSNNSRERDGQGQGDNRLDELNVRRRKSRRETVGDVAEGMGRGEEDERVGNGSVEGIVARDGSGNEIEASGEVIGTSRSEGNVVGLTRLATGTGEDDNVDTQTLLDLQEAEVFADAVDDGRLPLDIVDKLVPLNNRKEAFQAKSRNVREDVQQLLNDFKREFVNNVVGKMEMDLSGWIEEEVDGLDKVVSNSQDALRKLYAEMTELTSQKLHLTQRIQALEPTRLELVKVERMLEDKTRQVKLLKKSVGKLMEELEGLEEERRMLKMQVSEVMKLNSMVMMIRDGIWYGVVFGIIGSIVVVVYLSATV